MKTTHPEDLEFLRNIHGRFQDSDPKRRYEWVAVLIALVFFPALSVVMFFTFTPMSLDRHHLFIVTINLVGFISAVQYWRMRPVEIEFTGEEIIERRRGQIRNRMRISNIIETRVLPFSHRLILKTNNSKMNILIFPSLNKVIQKKVALEMSDDERKRNEKIAQQMKVRHNRAVLIYVIVLTGGAMVIGCLIKYLQK